MAELEATLGYTEWLEWVAFHALYDLPDGYLVAGQLGPPLAGLGGVKTRPHDFAPFLEPPPRAAGAAGNPSIKAAFRFLKTHAPQLEKQP